KRVVAARVGFDRAYFASFSICQGNGGVRHRSSGCIENLSVNTRGNVLRKAVDGESVQQEDHDASYQSIHSAPLYGVNRRARELANGVAGNFHELIHRRSRINKIRIPAKLKGGAADALQVRAVGI